MSSMEPDSAAEFAGLPGSIVGGKYRIERCIGRGGMGAVFLATNVVIGKRVALKFLSRDMAEDAGAAVRFQREAEAASLVESAHIVQIFDSGCTDDGLPFLVMELLTGEDLRSRLNRDGRLTPAAAIRITTQVLRALTQAHRAGIVHRDLKPDNVFVCARDDDPEFVKVVDFGISKLSRSALLDTLTRRGTVLGTAYYMSPEQAQSLPDIDGRTDLFSLGAILYEMLTGKPPHSGPTYESVLINICTKDAEDIRAKAPEVSESLAEVIERALARDREQRFQSAEEFLTALSAVDSEPSLSPVARGKLAARPAHSARHARYRTLVLSAIAMLAGFAVAAYWIASTRGLRRHAVTTAHAEPETTAAKVETKIDRAVNSDTAVPVQSASATPLPNSPPSLAAAGPSPQQGRTKPKPITSSKPPQPRASAGVAGSLQLSTREP